MSVSIECSLISYNIFLRVDTNSSYALSKYGSRSDEVRQIQTKLKRWGYYNGQIDGIFGSQTLAAVKWFQSKNGLTVDGIAGPKTLAAMGIYSSSTGNTTTNSSSDLDLLARLVNAEARGEPYAGQVAVGAVILNRVKGAGSQSNDTNAKINADSEGAGRKELADDQKSEKSIQNRESMS